MPTISGRVECTWTRSPGPPPTVTLTGVRIIDDRLGGSGVLDVEPVPEEWRAVLATLHGKRATVDYTTPPLVISKVTG